MISLYLFIILPIIIATVRYLFPHKYIKILYILLQFCLLAGSIHNFIYVKYNGTVVQTMGGWSGYSGISLRADILSSVLLMLTSFLFFAMVMFNYRKMYSDKMFLFMFLLLQSLLSGVFLSNDLFNIYVLIEVSTIIVSILIMFKRDSQSIYDGMIYLFANIVAMLFFVFGIGFMYKIFGVLDMSGIKERMYLIEDPKTLILPFSLLITAVSLKAAVLPMFSWLPKAHATPSAPSVVSAILSGLYVKTGIYLFLRIQEMFAGMIDTSQFFMFLGFLTGVIGFILALSQTDIKLILAYSTISQIGLIMLGLNFPNHSSYWGSVYYIINHAFFKSVLFLTAGIIIEQYKTRNINEITGVFRKMPMVAISSIIAILGITGAPFFNGSISKYLIQTGASGNIAEYGILFINLGTMTTFMRYSSIMWGKLKGEKYSVDIYRLSVITVLALGCFAGGVFGQGFIEILFNQKVAFDFTEYTQKTFIYFANLIISLIVFKKLKASDKLFNRVREFELSFNGICFSITAFFCAALCYLFIAM